MAVTQISRIQVRRGDKEALPQSLEEGEFGFATDTGELFIGAPNLPKIADRNQTFPYQNVRVITEFDLVHTLHDHVVTSGPLFRVPSAARAPSTQLTYSFSFQGDPLNTDQIRYLDPINGQNPGDLRGRVISGARILYNNGNIGDVGLSAFTVVHNAGPNTPNSRIMLDLDELNMSSYPAGSTWQITFLNLDTIARWPLNESDSYVMKYSMTSNEAVNGLKIRRVGQLFIAADEFSVQLLDNGVDMNQNPDLNNYMRIIFSGHIETETDGSKTVVLTCTNVSYHDISITFAGDRWLHTTSED
jgi:Major tropism determinant N-terminal domain